MKKRIFAAFLAVMMLLSVFVLASCNNEEETSTEESKKELTPKELFAASFSNTFGSGEGADISGILGGTQEEKDTVGSFEIKFDKLSANGQDLASLGEISLKADISSDIENEISKLDIAFSMLGENPTASIISDNKNQKLYITDLLGVLDKAILFEMPEQEEENQDFEIANGIMLSQIDEKVITHVVTSAVVAVNKNVTDSAYTQEIKDVTVANKNFTGAKVITLTVTDEMAKTIASEFIDAILTNETIKTLLGDDFDKEEILKAEELPTAVRVINTIVEEKSVALDIEIDLPEEKAEESTDVEDDDDVAEDDEYEYDDEDDYVEERGYDSFAIRADYIDGNFKLDLGPVDENGKYIDDEGYIAVVYTLENGNEKFVLSLTEEDETTETIKLEGTYKDGKREGVFTFGEDEKNYISINYECVEKENSASFKLHTITVADEYDGIQTIPFEISATITESENMLTLTGAFKLTVEDEFDLSATLNASIEYKDVTIESVTDSIPAEDLDINSLLPEIAQKYPMISAFLGSIGGNEGGAEQDEVFHMITDDFGIWLPSELEAVENTQFDAAFGNDDVAVFLIEESFSSLSSASMTLEEYFELVRKANADKNPTEIKDNDSVPYMTFVSAETGYIYYLSACQGEDSFWLMQFCCLEEDYPEYEDLFHEWAWYADPYAGDVFEEEAF